MTGRRPALIVAFLLVAGAALFVVGTRLERSSEAAERTAVETPHAEPPAEATVEPTRTPGEGEPGHVEGAEPGHTGETVATEAPSATGEPSGHVESEAPHPSESFLGINPDSTGAVAAAVVVTVVVAGIVVAFPNAVVLVLVGLVALAFAALDMREVVHQINREKHSLVAVASSVAALHLASALMAFFSSRRRSPSPD